MTASPSPGNQNLILLAALGIGAYWFMTRKATAAPVYVRPGAGAAQTDGGAVKGQLIGIGGNLLGQLIKGWAGTGVTANNGLVLGQYGYGDGYTDYAPVNIPMGADFSAGGMASTFTPDNPFSLTGW